MPEPLLHNSAPPESPTGTPRIRPRRVPLWLVVGVILVSGFTAAGQLLPERYELARILCTILGGAIGAGLGIASPGLRRGGGAMLLLVAVAALPGCAALRPDAYTPQACYELKREARKAGSYRVGAGAVAAGLAAGGAVMPLVGDSKPAQVGLALGAVLFGAVGLAAGYTADDAQREWAERCPLVPVEQAPGGTLAEESAGQ